MYVHTDVSTDGCMHLCMYLCMYVFPWLWISQAICEPAFSLLNTLSCMWILPNAFLEIRNYMTENIWQNISELISKRRAFISVLVCCIRLGDGINWNVNTHFIVTYLRNFSREYCKLGPSTTWLRSNPGTCLSSFLPQIHIPHSMVHGASMGPMNFAFWDPL